MLGSIEYIHKLKRVVLRSAKGEVPKMRPRGGPVRTRDFHMIA